MSSFTPLLQLAVDAGYPFMVIGGHAVICYGIPRFTRDLDLLIPEESAQEWTDLLTKTHYRVYYETDAFIQFEPTDTESLPPLDLMLVGSSTWDKLSAMAEMRSLQGAMVKIAHPWHLISMKLHALSSGQRRADSNDWSDILQLIQVCKIDLADPEFRAMVIRYGGETFLNKLDQGE